MLTPPRRDDDNACARSVAMVSVDVGDIELHRPTPRTGERPTGDVGRAVTGVQPTTAPAAISMMRSGSAAGGSGDAVVITI